MTYLFIDLPISSPKWRESFRVIVNHLLLLALILNERGKQIPIQVEISLTFFLCFSNHQNQVLTPSHILSNGFQYYFGFVSWKYSFTFVRQNVLAIQVALKWVFAYEVAFFVFVFFGTPSTHVILKCAVAVSDTDFFIHRLFKDS